MGLRQSRLQENEPKHDDSGRRRTVSIDLLQFESLAHIGNVPAVSTLTWFKGDLESAKIHLERRLRLIIEKNQWLQGHISITGFKKCTLSFLEHTNTSKNDDDDGEFRSNPDENFRATGENFLVIPPEHSPLSRESPFEDIQQILRKADLEMKYGPRQPIFRVIAIPCSKNPHEHFALVVQLSHASGDGATFYQLHNMLCSIDDDRIVELNTDRIMRTKEMQAAVMGREEENYISSYGFGIRVFIGILQDAMNRKKRTITHGYVDPSKMSNIKEESAKEGNLPFVSSNDVITSWFMSRIACPTGMLAVDWRSRLEGHTDMHAGNYNNNILYWKEDYASPALIRKSLEKYRRVVTTKRMPGFFQAASKDISVVTNWATFAKKNEILDCEEDIHLPLFSTPATMQLLIVFRAGVGKVGLHYNGHSPGGVNPLDDAPFLENAVADAV